ncbi:MAG: hypothetical protein HC933_12400 [Pleurocapsa sp. SU_196_0]|nr:hypothetical protein [Pleurocapsa sp. SU_196_0]
MPGSDEFAPFLADLEAKGHTLYAALLRQTASAEGDATATRPPPSAPRTFKAQVRGIVNDLKRRLFERESPFGETVPNKRLATIALAVVPLLALGVYAYGYYSKPQERTNAANGFLSSALASSATPSSQGDLSAALPDEPSPDATGVTTSVVEPEAPSTASASNPPPAKPQVRQATPEALIEAPPADDPPEVFQRPRVAPASNTPAWTSIAPPSNPRPTSTPRAANTVQRPSGVQNTPAQRPSNTTPMASNAPFGGESASRSASAPSVPFGETAAAPDSSPSSGMIYGGAERSSEAAPSDSGLIYEGSSTETVGVPSAPSVPASPSTPPTADATREARTFTPTETINATLVLNVEVVSGSSAPVVASSAEGNWIGVASLALNRIQIQFTHLVREGRTLEVYGLAYDLESSQGLTAAVADVAPNLVPDLLRNGANALNTYAQGLLTGRTTTSANGVTVSSGNDVNLGTVIVGALGQTFKLPEGSQSFYRVARVPKGTKFMVLVGVGTR